ncbi:hypothetical protein MKX67_11220 [Cytobacillus sp. FSL W7-1323]|uniref:Holin n=1 Tax=Cytobacillus kochii TaxID=859143 RepID=A0A248TNK5_9BACI|nr:MULTISPECIES: hypothetical protein [Cytobacillus]ASV69814.1 hypothetical protein CKF48_22390 [Cytobacillus kochii]MDQ0184604.1 hypothetical protein [Cytobacillus kochii]MEA1852178.1 hypothetical protein [Cytobacillus sp. OWB-43]MED1606707.1 hypothetical protein [Cytobacillus kochii]
MEFPVIHTNFWDAMIAIPIVIIFTQMLKYFLGISKPFVPTVAILIGLIVSIFISHRGDLIAGVFMGYFYGYGAIGSYASLKTSLLYFRNKK